MQKQQTLELILTLSLLLGCVLQAGALPSPSPGAGSGLEGAIVLHGISGGPVVQGVPDEKPLAQMSFVVLQGEATVATFTTDDQGRFRISLPPGHYQVVRKDWKTRVGFYGPFEVEVTAGQMKKVQWNCETGMQ